MKAIERGKKHRRTLDSRKWEARHTSRSDCQRQTPRTTEKEMYRTRDVVLGVDVVKPIVGWRVEGGWDGKSRQEAELWRGKGQGGAGGSSVKDSGKDQCSRDGNELEMRSDGKEEQRRAAGEEMVNFL
jgi:hypothetical protein